MIHAHFENFRNTKRYKEKKEPVISAQRKINVHFDCISIQSFFYAYHHTDKVIISIHVKFVC